MSRKTENGEKVLAAAMIAIVALTVIQAIARAF